MKASSKIFLLGLHLAMLHAFSATIRASEQAVPANSMKIVEGLTFQPAAPELTLDLFLPQNHEHPAACVLVIQGGGFLPQDGKRFRFFADFLAESGFAAALISYRGRPDHEYRETIADCKAAVRFLRQHSQQYGLDPNRLGAMGRSAGGTLAALLAVTGDKPEWEDSQPSQYSSSIQAAVAMAGVFDFVARFTDPEQLALQPRYQNKLKTNGQWIGSPFAPNDANWLQASAIQHIDAGDAPTLFLHCKDDSTVPWQQSQEMHEKMLAAGIPCELRYFDSGGHGFSGLGEQPQELMLEFFQKHLASPRD